MHRAEDAMREIAEIIWEFIDVEIYPEENSEDGNLDWKNNVEKLN